MSDTPSMATWHATRPTRAVVLVLHGGAEAGLSQVRPWGLAYLRMLPVARALHRACARHGVEVRLLRNRLRGWNEPELHPVADARWALEDIRAARPGVPVFLVGHSMGGRVALRVADDPAVTAVCALAPWTPDGEPVDAVCGRDVVIAHGVHDRITKPAESFAYAVQAQHRAARIIRFEVLADGHAMLRRPVAWNRLIRAFTLDAAGVAASPAWSAPPGGRFLLPV